MDSRGSKAQLRERKPTASRVTGRQVLRKGVEPEAGGGVYSRRGLK